MRNGSINVVQSKLTGWHFGCGVGLMRQLAVWSRVIAFGSERRAEGIDNKEVLAQKVCAVKE